MNGFQESPKFVFVRNARVLIGIERLDMQRSKRGGVIYKLVNKLNGKVYVGQTTMTIRRRIQCHIDNAKKASKKSISIIGLALVKYGKDNFQVETLQECKTQRTLNKGERVWIENLKSYSPLGYNIREGGGNKGRMAESSKEKLKYPRTKKMRERMSVSAKKRGMSKKQLKNLEKGRGWKPSMGSRVGERNPNAKLNSVQVKTIRKLFATGEYSQKKIGQMFGLTQIGISVIVRKIRWKHI